MGEQSADRDRNLTGHALAEANWLDVHFEAFRPEYEAMLRTIGLEPGWRVLDGGCGSGSFLPLLAELVGPTGHVTALDVSPDNLARVDERVASGSFTCPVATRAGTVTALPYPDDYFDAVWSANVSQYLTDEELTAALAESRRVVRPGGLVAFKEGAGEHMSWYPADAAVLRRLLDANRRMSVQAHGILRARGLRRWLERAGLTAVWQRTTLVERWAPLNPVERTYVGNLLAFMTKTAEQLPLPDEDAAFWRAQDDPASSNFLANHPEFYWCQGYVVAVGRVS
jgi:SAM-dependent methyltransferase